MLAEILEESYSIERYSVPIPWKFHQKGWLVSCMYGNAYHRKYDSAKRQT